MENIANFKKVTYYKGTKELTEEEVKALGMASPVYMSLDECAYQAAYDISNDWAKEVPEWKDVMEGYKKGVEDGIKYASRMGNDVFRGIAKGTGLFKEDK